MREIKCLMVMPGQVPMTTTLEASVTAFNKAVSVGSEYELIAVSKQIGKRTYILHAYDSVLEAVEPNRKVGDEIICGVFYVVAVDNSGIPISMTERQIMKYILRFYEPEKYSYHDVLENWSDCLIRELEEMDV